MKAYRTRFNQFCLICHVFSLLLPVYQHNSNLKNCALLDRDYVDMLACFETVGKSTVKEL